MAYVSPFDTIVCELRYKLFLWTIDLRRDGYQLNFTLTEFKNLNQIDLDITLRDEQGDLVDLFWLQDLSVDIGLIHYVTNLMNGHLVQY